MKRISLFITMLITIMTVITYIGYQPDNLKAETTKPSGSKVVIYYLHNNFRCPSCIKIENYTKEAINNNFSDKLKSGTLAFKVINFDEKSNKHYVNDYQLYTKSVVLSRVKNGKQVEWKNLDKIWTLLGDKSKFQQYIKSETTTFLKGSK